MGENKGFLEISYNSRNIKSSEEENTKEIEFTTITTKKIGDPIYFYVEGHNYQVIPQEWKQEIDYVPPCPAYIKVGGRYEPIDQEYYKEHKYQTYYWINGTGEKDCPACSGDGLLLGDDGIEYTCPRCKGIGHLYFLTKPVPVTGISVNLQKVKMRDDQDEEEKLIIKYMAIPPGTYVNRILTEDELISEDEVNKYLGKEIEEEE